MIRQQQFIILMFCLFIISIKINKIEAHESIKIEKQQENPDIKIIVEKLAKLKEIKELQNYITSTKNKSRGVSYILDPETKEIYDKNFYRIRVGINGKYRWEGHYIFYFNKKNLKEYYIEDTVVGDIVYIEVWRDRERKRNNKNRP